MDWNRSETIALANNNCTHCQGLGLRKGRGAKDVPCGCVFRAIFRACHTRFRSCVTKEKHMSRVSVENCSGKDTRRIYGRRDEEYIADFCLVSRRALDDFEYQIFRFHFLLGADWKMCCRRLNIDRGTFFHAVYRIQERLGRTYRELRPYSLFPLDEYFGGKIQTSLRRPPASEVIPIRQAGGFLQPAILKTA